MSARRLALSGVGAGLLCIAFILLYTRFPQVPERRYIFDYLLRTQDVPGAAMVIFIAVAAAFAPLARAGLALVEAIGRRPWATALITFLVLCAGQLFVAKDHALAGEHAFEQRLRLESEGVAFSGIRVRMAEYRHVWFKPRKRKQRKA